MNKRSLRHSFSLLHVERVKLNDKWNYTNVISPYCRIYYIDHGEGTVSSGQQSVQLRPGALYMIPSFTLCDLHCSSSLGQYFLHFFEESADGLSLFENKRRVWQVAADDLDIALFKRVLEINPGRGINRSNNPKAYEKNELYNHYQELNKLASDSHYLETQGILLQLVSRFLDASNVTDSREQAIPPKIFDAIRYIQLHLSDRLTVEQLAKRVNQHPDYFSRLFYRATGERPLVYIQGKRIERAQYLIATTGKSYAEIAGQTGFENVPYFSKVFKKMTGMTPGQYKANTARLV